MTNDMVRRRIRRRLSTSVNQYYNHGLPKVILLKPLPTIPPTDAPTPSPTKHPTTFPTLSPSGTPVSIPVSRHAGSLVSFAAFAPVLVSIAQYTSFLGFVLAVWIFYLLLPKGFRRRYCGAYPKRYKRVRGKNPGAGQWIFSSDTFGSGGAGNHSRLQAHGGADSREESNLRLRNTRNMQRQTSSKDSQSLTREDESMMSSMLGPGIIARTPKGKDKYFTGDDGFSNQEVDSYTTISIIQEKPPPSPVHPSIEKVPSDSVLSETMRRLKGRGIRLIAHGVQCEPKRVWIKFDEDAQSLSWQTEFPRRVPNQTGDVSIVLMRGSVHKIGLPNVLYIDVGKRTSALMRQDSRTVLDSCCFSLLTQNGSLDLQTSSRLERDALVSCFCLILDHVHERDWRLMYEDGSSVVSSSVHVASSINSNMFGSDFVEI